MDVLKARVAERVAKITEEYFGLHGRGHDWYEGAPWYRQNAQVACRKLAEDIRQSSPDYTRLFSPKYITQLVRGAVTDTVRRGDLNNVAVMVDRLFARLANTDQKKRIYIPIAGVEFQETLDIGPFRLQWMDKKATEEAISLVQRSIGWTTNLAHHKAIEKRRVRHDMNKKFLARPCFVYEAIGDTHKVEDEALDTLPTVFDVLRYSVPADPAGQFKRKNIVIGLPVEGRPGAYERYIVPLGESDGAYGGSWSPTGTLRINAPQLEFMKELGVFKIAESLQRSGTDFEADLANAVHWYAESQTQAKAEHELVNLIVAVETLFPRKHERDGVTGAVCDTIALLLTSTPDERLELYTFMRSSYAARGDVSHRGSTVGFPGLNRLRHVVQGLIAKLIENPEGFTTAFELRDWTDRQGSGLLKLWKDSRASAVSSQP